MSGWSHSARKRKLALSPGVALRSKQVRLTCVAGVTGKGEETKGTPALAFSLSLFLIGPTLKTSPISQCHQQCLCHQQWLLVGSSQFARVVKGVNFKIHCTQVRMGSNPIADMSGWSHSARKRKLALSPGVALRSTQARMGTAPSLTHVAGDTRKGRKRKEHVVCLSVTPFG